MGTVIVRYRVKPERAQENISLIEAVMAELNQKKPEGLRYVAFVADDGVTFFHTVFVDVDENPLIGFDTFKAFQKDIADRCDESPKPVKVEEIGSYNFHAPEISG